jgi:hypothetical protein
MSTPIVHVRPSRRRGLQGVRTNLRRATTIPIDHAAATRTTARRVARAEPVSVAPGAAVSVGGVVAPPPVAAWTATVPVIAEWMLQW